MDSMGSRWASHSAAFHHRLFWSTIKPVESCLDHKTKEDKFIRQLFLAELALALRLLTISPGSDFVH